MVSAHARDLRARLPGALLDSEVGGEGVRRTLSTQASVQASRRRFLALAVIFLVSVGALIPLFRWNVLETADETFFTHWDIFSESLVLSKIESTTPGAVARGVPRAGLLLGSPNAGAVYATFDHLQTGAVASTHTYDPYISNLGLQGFFFDGLYHAGCSTQGCLEGVSSGLTAITFVLFGMLLCCVSRRSFGAVFILTAAASPWIVSSAKNLYWVPWTWVPPACAAIYFIRASTRSKRMVAGAALFLLFMLRFGTGFEYITSIALLAAAMPLVRLMFHRDQTTFRRALLDSAIILGIGVLAFLLTVGFLLVDVDPTSLASSWNYIWTDATKRTYGGTGTSANEALALTVSPLKVLFTYVFGWSTDVVSLGAGTPLAIILGPQSMWLLIVGAAVATTVRFWRGQYLWRRDAGLLLIGLIIPLSWYVLAKAHSFIHTPMNFVLWYLLGVSTMLWLVGRWAVDLAVEAFVRTRHAVVLPSGAQYPGEHDKALCPDVFTSRAMLTAEEHGQR